MNDPTVTPDEVWIKKQLEEIEKLQKAIIVQQGKADETLTELKKESALILHQIGEVHAGWGSRRELRDVEKLQKEILKEQDSAQETLADLKRESFLLLKKIDDLQKAVSAKVFFVSPELESALKEVSLRAISIDQKVSDSPSCS